MPKNVRVIDRGWKRIKEELRKADNSFTKVGFPLGAEVGKKRRNPKKKVQFAGKERYRSISQVAEIAAYQEFGTEFIPARPFMSTSFDESQVELTELKKKLYDKILEGRLTTERALVILGEFMSNKTKRKIKDITSPPNRPSTIKRKGSSNPLIDTAQMINSVTHVEVVK